MVIDVEGNKYKTIQIGKQLWMAENLKALHYRDGSSIENAKDIQDRHVQFDDISKVGSFSYGHYLPVTKDRGVFYNWYAVNNRKNIAPLGWHVPFFEEWEELINFVGGPHKAGGVLKRYTPECEPGRNIPLFAEQDEIWLSPNKGAEFYNGFDALPYGYNQQNLHMGGFRSNARFWAKSNKSVIVFMSSTEGVLCIEMDECDGCSIRCVKD